MKSASNNRRCTVAEYPVNPPQNLMEKWVDDWFEDRENADVLLMQAAQWGADRELEACCEWLAGCGCPSYGRELRTARRPKPPSLKQEALLRCNDYIDPDGTIRRALESIPDDAN
jgi:hypothetical protein